MRSTRYLLATAISLSLSVGAFAQTGDEIIQKHIDATGGEANWGKVNTLKMIGSMTVQGMELGMTTTTLKNKGTRLDMTIMGTSGYTIATPTEGWMYMPAQGINKPTPLQADQLKDSQEDLNISAQFFADKSFIVKSEYLGKDTANKMTCHKVRITNKLGNERTLFIDVEKFNVVRTERTGKIGDEESKETSNYSNFTKTQEGVTIPMTFGTPQGDIVFKSAEINKPVDEKIFKPQ